MKTGKKNLNYIDQKLTQIIDHADRLEKQYAENIEKVDPLYRKSALNLVHYLALRSFDIEKLQEKLSETGLPPLAHSEPHVMSTLLSIKTLNNYLRGIFLKEKKKGIVSVRKSSLLIEKNSKMIFGRKPAKRSTRIMVTIPASAADDYQSVCELLRGGMNIARINCAHDNPSVWKRIIENVKKGAKSLDRQCMIVMDLAGPKTRTGAIKSRPGVIHVKPSRNSLGKITSPAKIWIAPSGLKPPGKSADFTIPVEKEFLKKIRKGSFLHYRDLHNKKGKIFITGKQGDGKWGICENSSYLLSGTRLYLGEEKSKDNPFGEIENLDAVQEYILLKKGDILNLHSDPLPGENAVSNLDGRLLSYAHISCTNPDVFSIVKPGEEVFFDDGKIEGVVVNVREGEMDVEITEAKPSGSKLKSDKGINFPQSSFSSPGFTEKDKTDIDFILEHADAVNLSFVNTAADISPLIDKIKEKKRETGLIIKIETRAGFKNLPDLLLSAMQTYPAGVMLARGDLAIESGWKNFATIQEEILRICGAAHVPVIWATQVLENLAKKGFPTRAEITDAAFAQRAQCVMLNNGKYIDKAVKMLDKILRRMEKFQKRQNTILPKLEQADKLVLSHEKYDI